MKKKKKNGPGEGSCSLTLTEKTVTIKKSLNSDFELRNLKKKVETKKKKIQSHSAVHRAICSLRCVAIFQS